MEMEFVQKSQILKNANKFFVGLVPRQLTNTRDHRFSNCGTREREQMDPLLQNRTLCLFFHFFYIKLKGKNYKEKFWSKVSILDFQKWR
jgi:hypothetical protein